MTRASCTYYMVGRRFTVLSTMHHCRSPLSTYMIMMQTADAEGSAVDCWLLAAGCVEDPCTLPSARWLQN